MAKNEYVITMDADLQDDPKEITNLIKKIEVYSKAKSNGLNVSYCTKDLNFDGKTISQENFEIIYVLSEKKSFDKQIEEIEKQCLN